MLPHNNHNSNNNSAVCSPKLILGLSNQNSVLKFFGMIIFVKSVDRVFPVTVPEEGTVHDLKAAIEDVEFIPAGNL